MDNWLEFVSNMEAERIQKIINIISNRGFVTDEDECLGPMVFKYGKEELIDRLIKEGYSGGELLSIGDFYPLVGQLLAIYDSNKLQYRHAKKELDFYAEESRKQF